MTISRTPPPSRTEKAHAVEFSGEPRADQLAAVPRRLVELRAALQTAKPARPLQLVEHRVRHLQHAAEVDVAQETGERIARAVADVSQALEELHVARYIYGVRNCQSIRRLIAVVRARRRRLEEVLAHAETRSS